MKAIDTESSSKLLDSNIAILLLIKQKYIKISLAQKWIKGLWFYLDHSRILESMLTNGQESLFNHIYSTLSEQDKRDLVPKLFSYSLLMDVVSYIYRFITSEKEYILSDTETAINSILQTFTTSSIFIVERIYCLKQLVEYITSDQV